MKSPVSTALERLKELVVRIEKTLKSSSKRKKSVQQDLFSLSPVSSVGADLKESADNCARIAHSLRSEIHAES